MTDTPVTVTLTEREWEQIIYCDAYSGPADVKAKIEEAIAEQVPSCD